LTGPIPESFAALNLKEFQVYENRLQGNIPESFYNNRDLELMRVDFNGLSGTLSTQVGLLTNLFDLRVNQNLLVGNLPISLSNLSNLGEYLFLNFYCLPASA
jgi:hypothetical protein